MNLRPASLLATGGNVGFSLGFDAANKVGCLAYDGELTGQIFLAGLAAARNWVADKGPVPTIVDFTAVTQFNVGVAALKEFAQSPPILPEQTRRIIVVPQSRVLTMVRLFQLFSGKRRPPLQVVRTMDDACTFLGISRLALVEAVRG
ncbi:MAG: hypothetical protein ABSD20_10300 [Terriglobales bacterium]